MKHQKRSRSGQAQRGPTSYKQPRCAWHRPTGLAFEALRNPVGSDCSNTRDCDVGARLAGDRPRIFRPRDGSHIASFNARQGEPEIRVLGERGPIYDRCNAWRKGASSRHVGTLQAPMPTRPHVALSLSFSSRSRRSSTRSKPSGRMPSRANNAMSWFDSGFAVVSSFSP